MTTLQTAITEAEQLRERIAGLKLDHPWDQHVRQKSLDRLDSVRGTLDAMLSDLRVAACRMRDGGPCNRDPATDQAVPPEPANVVADPPEVFL